MGPWAVRVDQPGRQLSGSPAWPTGRVRGRVLHWRAGGNRRGLHRVPRIPELVYAWSIERVQRQTALFIEVRTRYFERNASKRGWVDVEVTDAWNDDEGSAEYLLHCRKLDVPPKRRSATAIHPLALLMLC